MSGRRDSRDAPGVIARARARADGADERMGMIHSYMILKRFPKHLRLRVHRYFRRYFEQRTALNESVAWEVSVGAPKSGSATRAAVRGAMQGVFGAGPPIK